MKTRDVVLIWGPLGLLSAIISFSVIAGFFRGPIDEGYMLRIDTLSRKHGERWATVEPIAKNYWIGSWGTVLQIRDGDECYQITANRYLNILPDVIHSPKATGLKYIIHK